MTPEDVSVWMLTVLPVFDWAVVIVLGFLTYRNPNILTLRERFVAACALAIIASIASFLGFVRLGFIVLTNGEAIGLLILAMTLASVPALLWLVLLVSGRFRLPGPDDE